MVGTFFLAQVFYSNKLWEMNCSPLTVPLGFWSFVWSKQNKMLPDGLLRFPYGLSGSSASSSSAASPSFASSSSWLDLQAQGCMLRPTTRRCTLLPPKPPPSSQVMFRYIGTTFWASRNYLVWWLPFLFFFSSSSSPSSSSFLLSRLVSCLSRRDTEQANRFTHTHTRRSGHQGVSCWVSTLCRCCFYSCFFRFLLFDIVPRSSPFWLFLVILGDPG